MNTSCKKNSSGSECVTNSKADDEDDDDVVFIKAVESPGKPGNHLHRLTKELATKIKEEVNQERKQWYNNIKQGFVGAGNGKCKTNELGKEKNTFPSTGNNVEDDFLSYKEIKRRSGKLLPHRKETNRLENGEAISKSLQNSNENNSESPSKQASTLSEGVIPLKENKWQRSPIQSSNRNTTVSHKQHTNLVESKSTSTVCVSEPILNDNLHRAGKSHGQVEIGVLTYPCNHVKNSPDTVKQVNRITGNTKEIKGQINSVVVRKRLQLNHNLLSSKSHKQAEEKQKEFITSLNKCSNTGNFEGISERTGKILWKGKASFLKETSNGRISAPVQSSDTKESPQVEREKELSLPITCHSNSSEEIEVLSEKVVAQGKNTCLPNQAEKQENFKQNNIARNLFIHSNKEQRGQNGKKDVHLSFKDDGCQSLIKDSPKSVTLPLKDSLNAGPHWSDKRNNEVKLHKYTTSLQDENKKRVPDNVVHGINGTEICNKPLNLQKAKAIAAFVKGFKHVGDLSFNIICNKAEDNDVSEEKIIKHSERVVSHENSLDRKSEQTEYNIQEAEVDLLLSELKNIEVIKSLQLDSDPSAEVSKPMEIISISKTPYSLIPVSSPTKENMMSRVCKSITQRESLHVPSTFSCKIKKSSDDQPTTSTKCLKASDEKELCSPSKIERSPSNKMCSNLKNVCVMSRIFTSDEQRESLYLPSTSSFQTKRSPDDQPTTSTKRVKTSDEKDLCSPNNAERPPNNEMCSGNVPLNGMSKAKTKTEIDSCNEMLQLPEIIKQVLQNVQDSQIPEYDSLYVRHFRNLLVSVMDDQNIFNLLNKEELIIMNCYFDLPVQPKECYIRLYNRKLTWHRVAELKYNVDLEKVIPDLEKYGFIISDMKNEDLCVLLDLLKLKQLRTLCSMLRAQYTNKTKRELIDNLLTFAHKQQVLHMGQLISAAGLLKHKVLEMLGYCIKLTEVPRKLFKRLEFLFSLTESDDEERSGTSPLVQGLLAERGDAEYPKYKIIKEKPIFCSRERLIRCQEVRDLKGTLSTAMMMKNWKVASDIVYQIRAFFLLMLQDDLQCAYDADLPLFLRKFTAGSVCARALTKGIPVLRKPSTDNDDEIMDLLYELLEQKVYLPHYRGRWYDQLCVLHRKKDNFLEITNLILDAKNDPHVDEIYQYMLKDRAQKILTCKKKGISIPLKEQLEEYSKKYQNKPPFTTIKAKALPSNVPGIKVVYVHENEELQEKTYASVEEFAIIHYQTFGFKEGIHAENSLIIAIFGLIFWDIIYESVVPDVFQGMFQSFPYDMRTEEFYTNRKEAIDKRLLEMETWSMQQMDDLIESRYKEHDGKISIVSWKLFSDSQQLLDLIHCMGINLVTKLCCRLAKSFCTSCSGFPDLVMWSPGESKCKFVEVKGPGDKLSPNQYLWMDYLISIGANAEVCYVITTGSKDATNK